MKQILLKKLIKVAANKYFLTALAFVIWSMYFDQNDWLTMRQRQKELAVVKGNISYLNTQIADMAHERDALLTDKRKLEQYARENYRMKHENEDVYVIDTEGK